MEKRGKVFLKNGKSCSGFVSVDHETDMVWVSPQNAEIALEIPRENIDRIEWRLSGDGSTVQMIQETTDDSGRFAEFKTKQ